MKPTLTYQILDRTIGPDGTDHVQVEVQAEFPIRGFTHARLQFEVPHATADEAIRERVAWKANQESGLSGSHGYTSEELVEAYGDLSAEDRDALVTVAAEIVDTIEDAIPEPKPKKKKGKR